jgi:lipopolysaccharide cholinephosphotransferase
MNFPKEFFQGENRDGFFVEPMMKRAWAAELEIMEAVLTVCDRHGLRCFADGGTLLGAIRHKGFIPWDDDMDFAMLREEYDELIHYLPKELPEGIVMAGMYADSERLQKASECVHLRVIADEEYWNLASYMSRFHGFPYFRIGIDIFPLDYVSTEPEDVRFQFDTCYAILFTAQNLELYKKDGLLEGQLREIEKATGCHLTRGEALVHELLLLYDRICVLTPAAESSEVTNIQFSGHTDGHTTGRPLTDYADVIYLPFEHTQIPAPVASEHVTRLMYGVDYMTPVRWSAAHDYPFYKKQEAALQEIFDADGMSISIEDFCHNWQAALGEV